MGLSTGSVGQRRGWLAALFCCGAATSDDEDPVERRMDGVEGTRIGVCNEQPVPLEPITVAAIPVQNEAGFDRYPISDRPPSLKPLDFGETSLLGRISFPSRSKSPNSNIARISIGHPTNFRRLDYTERQRRSLIPLQLEPVTLRDSVIDLGHDGSLDDPLYETQKENHEDRHRRSQPTRELFPSRPALSSHSSSSSIRSLRRQALETQSSTSSSSSQTIDWSRLSRKRMIGRKPSSESNELAVEREVSELNTIVEEKRSGSSRSRSSDGHVSAVAPLMPIKARSETLNDIGSAFSKPCQVDVESEHDDCHERASDPRTVSPMENRLSRPFTAMPDLSAIPDAETNGARPSSKIGGWLSNIIGTASRPAKRTRENFYNCTPNHHRDISEASTAPTELDSPIFTIESQWSHGHSRDLTSDSLMTPASTAPSTGRGFPEMRAYDAVHPSGTDSHSDVGLAF